MYQSSFFREQNNWCVEPSEAFLFFAQITAKSSKCERNNQPLTVIFLNCCDIFLVLTLFDFTEYTFFDMKCAVPALTIC